MPIHKFYYTPQHLVNLLAESHRSAHAKTGPHGGPDYDEIILLDIQAETPLDPSEVEQLAKSIMRYKPVEGAE